MDFRAVLSIIFLTLSYLFSPSTNAALIDRGAGFIYDTILDITWLQDANYAKTSGYDDDGRMTWDEAKTWANNLTVTDTLRNTTWSDWRLPQATPINGKEYSYIYSDRGYRDYGFNITSPMSEYSHLYYVSLGNHAYFDRQPGTEIENSGPFKNIQTYVYWTENTAKGWRENEDLYALTFNTGVSSLWGLQAVSNKTNFLYSWAVMDGDVGEYLPSAVPLPPSFLLLFSGLLAFIGYRGQSSLYFYKILGIRPMR